MERYVQHSYTEWDGVVCVGNSSKHDGKVHTTDGHSYTEWDGVVCVGNSSKHDGKVRTTQLHRVGWCGLCREQ